MRTQTTQRIRLGAKRQVTIPRGAAAKLQLNAGDVLEVRVLEDKIELVPMAVVPKDQLWYWTPEWQAKEKEADEDVAAGRIESFRSADELIRSLRRARKRSAKKSKRSNTAA